MTSRRITRFLRFTAALAAVLLGRATVLAQRPVYKPTPRSALTDSEFAAAFPARQRGAIGGSTFCTQVANMTVTQRDAAIYAQITSGNFPNFQRQFVHIPISGVMPNGLRVDGMLSVIPDCLAVGSDTDWIRMPMMPQTAQKIADFFHCVLPTKKMVDAMDAAATVRLTPQPLASVPTTPAGFVQSNQAIEQQRAGKPLGPVVCGAKNDVVVSNKIYQAANRVVIYGWRKLDGTVIQSLYNGHVNTYVDYSHGIRLVRGTVLVGTQRYNVADVLIDASRANLLSDEGVINPPRYPTN